MLKIIGDIRAELVKFDFFFFGFETASSLSFDRDRRES